MKRDPAFPAEWGILSWNLIADGMGGRVFVVERSDGTRAVVKQASAVVIREGENVRSADFLAWRSGAGAVELLGRHDDLAMLEYLSGAMLLDVFEKESDDDATIIAADVIRRLHAVGTTPPPATLEPLREHFVSLFRKAEADRRAGQSSQFVEAAETAERLLANQAAVKPLHGDIHHENIMRGARGWVAIDPKGLLGDPAFDIANMFYNPVESPLRTDQRRIAAMAGILADRLDQDVGKLLDYAFAFSALSASWHVEDGNFEEAQRSLAVGHAARAVRRDLSAG
ncbi:aminoglycoside phosphotransferase family protein [Chelativorans sp.]|uniref:aminoglycoside phosphotransferase family protein n=1 Tax=Chelativorans sp. TaxID=2203393 RepID=UPI0028110390|nr:aminoglycoside phosphotransferase family protein [Chelativorans sp.]